MLPTHALIPAAGRGSRLDALHTPKPLVEVGGRPLIVNLLLRLEKAGVARAVIVVGDRALEVERALFHHPELSLDLEFVTASQWERGLAHSLAAARGAMTEPFVLAMADHVFHDDHVRRLAQIDLGSDVATLLAAPGSSVVRDLESAVKVRTSDERVEAIGRELEGFDAIDIGLLLARPGLFDALDEAIATGDENDLSHALDRLARRGLVGAVDAGAQPWFDVDSPSDLVRAELEFRNRGRVERVSVPTTRRPGPSQTSEYSFTTGTPESTKIVVQRGLLGDAAVLELIPPERRTSPVFLFSDERVGGLYGDDLAANLSDAGYDVRRVVLPEGEQAKTLTTYAQMAEHVLFEGIDERSVLISLGGGTVCNACGFLAATLYRGIGLIHIPTTLMAQCDAAISHKQGINGRRGKNLVGSYYAPMAIAVDVDVLATLEEQLIADGLSEVIKHAVGQDREYLEFLLSYEGAHEDPAFLETVVRKNIELKCELMAADPKEHREGMVLQLGHEVGHAVEFLSGYDLTHGQSVAIGMMVSARVAHMMGGADSEVVDVQRSVLERYGLPACVPKGIDVQDVLSSMRYNKRYLVEGNRMALVHRLGEMWSVDGDYAIPVADPVLREALRASY